jgi:hypothetical protein
MSFCDLFSNAKPLIACIHLLPLPGAPNYSGEMDRIIDTALREASIFEKHGVDGLIVENFRDCPFYPTVLPPETVAALSVLTREVVRASKIPVGVNALRNDAIAAVASAHAAGAQFVRVNVHMGAVVSDQGILQGQSHETLRLRSCLNSAVKILADVRVKHATPIADRGLRIEAQDLQDRGLADALIVSGEQTGDALCEEEAQVVGQAVDLPVLAGSGVGTDNLSTIYSAVDGFIVGSCFKKDCRAENHVEEDRVVSFMDMLGQLRTKNVML